MRYGSVKAKTKQSDSFPSYKINAAFAQKGGRQWGDEKQELKIRITHKQTPQTELTTVDILE